MKALTIFVVPSDAVGHMNACAGSTRALRRRGHRVIYLTEECFKGKLVSQGFEEHNYKHKFKLTDENNNVDTEEANMKPGEKMARDLLRNKIIGPFPVEEKMQQMIKYFTSSSTAKTKLIARDAAIREAISLYDPDLFLVDKAYLEPAIYYSGKPWIRNNSFSPACMLVDENIPPGCSGFPSNDKSKWNKFIDLRKQLLSNKSFNDNLQELGYPRYEKDIIMPETQLLTIYAYPEELNYPQIRAKGWYNLEVFDRNAIKQHAKLEELLPQHFLKDTLEGRFSGKLVYLSLGSMGSVDLDLMKRLVRVLGKTEHKYIVSKGPRHEEFHLASNMFGDRFLPQTKIVPHMHLVISHGGNNTVTETFAIGKPMIVMPLFGDQFDNAQRIHETGYGIRLDPYQFDDEQMVKAVNQLLYDQQLHARLRHAANRIATSNAHELLCHKIEGLLAA